MKRLIFVLLALMLTACPPPRRIAISNVSDTPIRLVVNDESNVEIGSRMTLVAGDSQDVGYTELGYGGQPGARTFSIVLERNGCVAGVEMPARVDDEDFYQHPAEELTFWLVIDDTSIYLAQLRSWQGRASIDYTWIERQKSKQPVGYPVDVHWVCQANKGREKGVGTL